MKGKGTVKQQKKDFTPGTAQVTRCIQVRKQSKLVCRCFPEELYFRPYLSKSAKGGNLEELPSCSTDCFENY